MSACPSIRWLETLVRRDDAPDADTTRLAEVTSHVAGCRRCRVRVAELEKNLQFVDELDVSASGDRPWLREFSVDDSVEGYAIERVIGRGGQGIVVLARQLSTGRTVALKMLDGALSEPKSREERFAREVSLASHLEYPGIVTLFDSGTTARGRPFHAMQYIDGLPLDRFVGERAAAGSWSVNDAVRLFTKICDAVRYAHRNGVLHRDIKPANILVDRAGNPHVLDFGLAKRIDSPLTADLTRTGAWIGTLTYAAPEILSRAPRSGDTRADVFALGLVFFEMLAGRPAFDSARPIGDLVRERTEGVMPSVSSVRRGVDSDLDAMVRRALAREPEDRYASASELYDDLECYREGRPLAARRDSTLYLLRRIAMRHRRAAGGTVFLLAVAVALGVWILAAERRARNSARESREAARELAARLVESEVRSAARLPAVRAEDLIWPHHFAMSPGRGTDHEVVPMHDPPGPLLTYWALFDMYRRHPCLATYDAKDVAVSDVRFVQGTDTAVRVLRTDKTADTWHSARSSVLAKPCADGPSPPTPSTTAHSSVDRGSRLSADGRHCIVATPERIEVQEVNGGRVASLDFASFLRDGERPTKPVPTIISVACDATASRVAVADDSNSVHVFERIGNELRPVHRMRSEGASDIVIALAGDGSTLAVQNERGDLELCDVPGSASARFPGAAGGRRLGCLAFDGGGSMLATSRPAGDPKSAAWEALEIWRRVPGEPSSWGVTSRFMGESPFFGVVDVVDPFVSAAQRERVTVYDTRSDARTVLDGHRSEVRAVSLAIDGASAVTGDASGIVKRWETRANAAYRRWPDSESLACQMIAFSPDAERILAVGGRTGGSRGFVRLSKGRGIASTIFELEQSSVVAGACWSSSGDRVAWARHDGAVFEARVDVEGRIEIDQEWHLDIIANAIVYAVDDSRLFVATDHGVVVLRSGQTEPALRFRGPERRVPEIDRSPSGNRLVGASMGGAVWMWSVDPPIVEGTVIGRHDAGVRTVRFSPDGKTLASAGDDGLVRLWNVDSGSMIASLSGHAAQVFAIAWSPDGSWLASSDALGEVRVWERSPARLLAVLPAMGTMAATIDIDSRWGGSLAIGSLAGGIACWDLRYYDRHIAGNLDARLRGLQTSRRFDPRGIRRWREWAAEVLRRSE